MEEETNTGTGDATSSLAPVFVVGPARSGTTVFTHTLARKYTIACVPETNLIAVLLKMLARSKDATFADFEAKQRDVLMHGQNRPYSILFTPEMRTRRMRDCPDALFEAILRCDRYTEGDRVIEQTPRNGERVRLLRWMFPSSLVFFMSRNPVDVIASNRRTPWGTRNRLKLFLVLLRPYFELRELARTYGLGHTMIVEYEKLADVAQMAEVFGALESRGTTPREAEIDIEPINYSNNDWARDHFRKAGDRLSLDHKPLGPQQRLLRCIGAHVQLRLIDHVRTGRSGPLVLLLSAINSLGNKAFPR